MYVLVNSMGIVLGVYGERYLANKAINLYEKEKTVSCPTLYLYEIHADCMNKRASNTFKCVWSSSLASALHSPRTE